MENLVDALGGTPVDFPAQDRMLRRLPDGRQARDRRRQDLPDSLGGARPGRQHRRGQLPAVRLQPRSPPGDDAGDQSRLHTMPILYFTQLMAMAFGCDESVLRFDLHHIAAEAAAGRVADCSRRRRCPSAISRTSPAPSPSTELVQGLRLLRAVLPDQGAGRCPPSTTPRAITRPRQDPGDCRELQVLPDDLSGVCDLT